MTFRLTAVLGSLFALSLFQGCSLLPERSAQATFLLPTPAMATHTGPAIPLTLLVKAPLVESPLDGTRILVNPDGHQIQAYAGVRWSKPTPVLIRDHWIEGLRQHGGLMAVISDTSGASSDLTLSSDLTRFRIQYQIGQPMVSIQLDAQLLDSRSREVIAAKRFSVQQKIAIQPTEVMISGFGEASQLLTEQLVSWLLPVSREFHGTTLQ